MNGHALTITDNGFTGQLVTVECHLSNNLPGIVIVGLANRALDEAKERIRSAFASAKLALPKKRITINLAPADLPKDGSSFDLAIAAAIMEAGGLVPKGALENIVLIGELSLDGLVRPVRGIIGKLRTAKELGIANACLPESNSRQACLVGGLNSFTTQTLGQFCRLLGGLEDPVRLTTITVQEHLKNCQNSIKNTHTKVGKEASPALIDFADVTGQSAAKRALEIAAAGHHNVLLNGPPGTGKSMLAKAFAGILPSMNLDEIAEVTQLHSLVTPELESVHVNRPFRAPHHTASSAAILGGGASPRPGEISLSHRGVLLLDEFPEFARDTIEALRQPLEDRTITIVRAKTTTTYPADFILVATRNPCPCGYFGSTKACECSTRDVMHYERRLSGPILDRIDLHVTVDTVKHHALLTSTPAAETSQDVRRRVEQCRTIQAQRFTDPTKTNASMTNTDIKSLALLDRAGKTFLDRAAGQLHLSARSYLRCVRVARTIADLAGSRAVTSIHVAEALQYRSY